MINWGFVLLEGIECFTKETDMGQGSWNIMMYKKYIFDHSDGIYFSHMFGLYSHFQKMLQSHEGAIGVLLLMKVICGPHPRWGLVTRRTNPVIRGLEPSVPTSTPTFGEGRGAGG